MDAIDELLANPGALQQALIQLQIQTAMLKKANDLEKQQGAAVLQLLDAAAAEPAQEAGRGAQIDQQA